MMRVVQIQNGANRRVALVEEPDLKLIAGMSIQFTTWRPQPI